MKRSRGVFKDSTPWHGSPVGLCQRVAWLQSDTAHDLGKAANLRGPWERLAQDKAFLADFEERLRNFALGVVGREGLPSFPRIHWLFTASSPRSQKIVRYSNDGKPDGKAGAALQNGSGMAAAPGCPKRKRASSPRLRAHQGRGYIRPRRALRGPDLRGEENAWVAHSKMFSHEALPALTSETKGQNSWVNNGPHADLPVADRPFAEQKAGLLPEKYHGPQRVRL